MVGSTRNELSRLAPKKDLTLICLSRRILRARGRTMKSSFLVTCMRFAATCLSEVYGQNTVNKTLAGRNRVRE